MRKRGRTKPLAKPFPKGKQHTWSQQQLFMKLSNMKQEIREPYLYGDVRSLFGIAKFQSQS